MSLTKQQQLARSLQEEISCAENLLTTLKTEAEALCNYSVDLLESSTKNKIEEMKKLETATQMRSQLLTRLNAKQEGNAVNVGAGLSIEPPFATSKELNTLWNTLLTLAKECQELNLINSRVIDRGYQQSRHALDIIQGQTSNNTGSTSNNTYDQAGQTDYAKRSRSIAQV